jgi:hypothetical protein
MKILFYRRARDEEEQRGSLNPLVNKTLPTLKAVSTTDF